MERDKQKKIKELQAVVERFQGKKILVIGDLMLDEYIWGESSRLSPEAPVPVVLSRREEKIPGGAFNVVNNLRELGAEVYIIGTIGEDSHGKYIVDFADAGSIHYSGIIVRKDFPTTLKTRILAGSQQVVRLDREEILPLSESELKQTEKYLTELLPEIDGIIISDYAKGVVDARLIRKIVNLNRNYNKPIAVDPQVKHFMDYKNVFTLTPNHHEAGGAYGKTLDSVELILEAGRKLIKKLKSESLLITRGKDGMTLFYPDERYEHIPTVARKVFDVTGAGDTVIAVFLIAYVAGCSLKDAAVLANIAAGLVVGEVGTATISPSVLKKNIKEAYLL